jgi:hypothetical protein
MRARMVFILLLICILLIAFGPALIAVVSQTVAEGFGCQVDLNRVIPCVASGRSRAVRALGHRGGNRVFRLARRPARQDTVESC